MDTDEHNCLQIFCKPNATTLVRIHSNWSPIPVFIITAIGRVVVEMSVRPRTLHNSTYFSIKNQFTLILVHLLHLVLHGMFKILDYYFCSFKSNLSFLYHASLLLL